MSQPVDKISWIEVILFVTAISTILAIPVAGDYFYHYKTTQREIQRRERREEAMYQRQSLQFVADLSNSKILQKLNHKEFVAMWKVVSKEAVRRQEELVAANPE